MTQNATILLVEDEKWMLEGIEDLVQTIDIGYSITTLTANNGIEALKVLENNFPDLIVSDIMMPKMDGIEFLKHVRSDSQTQHIPFIFLTARSEPQDRLQGSLSGADLYCIKPFKTDELLGLVKTQLDKSFRHQSAQEETFTQFKKGLMQILNHEFRTPLTYVTAYSEMLVQGFNAQQQDNSFQDYLRGIRVGCIRLSKLVEEFIFLIDLQSGNMQSQFVREKRQIEDFPQLLHDIINHFEPAAKEKNVSLQLKNEGQIPSFVAHVEMLHRIFHHLIDNAIKFTFHHQRRGGTVSIVVRQENDYLSVAIQDEGMGIAQSEQQLIFEPFYQHQRDAYEQQGAGIGLSIVKELVQLHGGQIVVHSKNESATFEVQLPLYQADDETNQPSSAKGTKTVSVLVVEDNINLLQGLQELMEISQDRYEMNVTTAVNGLDALSKLEQMSPPHLIVSDIMMPRMNGYDFLEAVRQTRKWAFIPFIFLTAKGEKRDMHKGFISGAEEYITKPYNGDELLAIVYKQLDRYFLRQTTANENLFELKQKILALISPEFHKPLTLVESYSDQLEDGVNSAKTTQDLVAPLRGIQASSNELTKLVDDFIALAELETGEKKNAYSMSEQLISSVGLLPFEAAERCFAEAQNANVTLNYYLPSGLPNIRGVESMLQNVFHIFTLLMIEELREANGAEVDIGYSWSDDDLSISYVANKPLGQERIMMLAPLVHERLSLKQASHQHPQLIIAKKYIELHNGQLSLKTDDYTFAFVLSFPITIPEY